MEPAICEEAVLVGHLRSKLLLDPAKMRNLQLFLMNSGECNTTVRISSYDDSDRGREIGIDKHTAGLNPNNNSLAHGCGACVFI